ncbi:MAG: hypothetical protein LBS70_08380 [Candidatus Accumulibacter sp.]|jgi:hypothetical protein|nr:hypothetical protein [Accumulibacter sp.]
MKVFLVSVFNGSLRKTSLPAKPGRRERGGGKFSYSGILAPLARFFHPFDFIELFLIAENMRGRTGKIFKKSRKSIAFRKICG